MTLLITFGIVLILTFLTKYLDKSPKATIIFREAVLWMIVIVIVIIFVEFLIFLFTIPELFLMVIGTIGLASLLE